MDLTKLKPSALKRFAWKCPNEENCLDKRYVCNGKKDLQGFFGCAGGEDEGTDLCTEDFCRDELNQWKCPDGPICLHKYRVCDGTVDCEEGGDEDLKCTDNGKCINNATRLCTKSFCENILGKFKCPDEAKCIPPYNVCDGKLHCLNGFDETEEACNEQLCNETNRWKCPNESKCLYMSNVCDGTTDCLNGYDEVEDLCTEQYCSTQGKMKCRGESKCILDWFACDGEEDCIGGEDEAVSICGSE